MIYVAAHKPCKEPLPADYAYIQVNAAANPPFAALNDATGENISAKNPYYCELTAIYWVWKNDKTHKTVGLAHYRRFLTENKFSSSVKHYLRAETAEKLLKRYDFIATKLYRTRCTVEEHLLENVRKGDLGLLRESVARVCPDYLPAYDAVLAGHESYLLNMFVCKKPLWDQYCEWLFPLLSDLETAVDMTGYSVQEQRLYGYLAERLFTVYVRKNHFRVKSLPTHLVGVPKRKVIIDKLKKIFSIS